MTVECEPQIDPVLRRAAANHLELAAVGVSR